MLSQHVFYLRLKPSSLLPILTRRAILKKIESFPEVDFVSLTEG